MENNIRQTLTGKSFLALQTVLLVISCSFQTFGQNTAKDHASPLTVFLVRHAEKVTQEMDMRKDPPLSKEGDERALQLAEVLKDAGIQYIHSTDFMRTRQTAAPIANTLGLDIKDYNPGNLQQFAETLHNKGGRHLVVGHSNTTPELVRLLGGDPGKPIDEKSEYDRLYIVTVSSENEVHTVLLRYGELYKP